MVQCSGFLTAKGGLVRSILYPPPSDFKFEQDSYKFVLFLAMTACVGMLYTTVRMAMRSETVGDILLEVSLNNTIIQLRKPQLHDNTVTQPYASLNNTIIQLRQPH